MACRLVLGQVLEPFHLIKPAPSDNPDRWYILVHGAAINGIEAVAGKFKSCTHELEAATTRARVASLFAVRSHAEILHQDLRLPDE